jgi:hypothetical protein
MILISIAEWARSFDDSVVTASFTIPSSSKSKNQAIGADLMPEHVRSKAQINSPTPAHSPRRRGSTAQKSSRRSFIRLIAATNRRPWRSSQATASF